MAYLSISKLNKLDDSALRKEVAREIKHTNQMLRRIDAKGLTSKAADNLRRRIGDKYISTKGKTKAELIQIIRDVRQFKKAKGHNVSGIKAINKTRTTNIKNRTKRKTVYNQRNINNSAAKDIDNDNVIDVGIDSVGDIWDDYGYDHYMEYIQQNYPEFYSDFLKALEKYPELNYDTNFIYYNNADFGVSAREMGEMVHEEMRIHVGRIIRSMKDAHENTTGRDWSQFSEI